MHRINTPRVGFSNAIRVFSNRRRSSAAEPDWPRPLWINGRDHAPDVNACFHGFHLPACNGSSFAHHVASVKMAFNAVAAAVGRALRSGGSGTPPLLRSPKATRLSPSRTLTGASQQGGEVTKSSDSCTGGPGSDAPSSGEAAHRCASAEKRTKEPLGAPGVRGERRRSFTSAAPADTKSYMWARYNDTKRLVHGKKRVPTFSQHIPHVHPPSAPSVVPPRDAFLHRRHALVLRRCLQCQRTSDGQMAIHGVGTSEQNAFSG